MTTAQIPPQYWDKRYSALVLLLAATPLLSLAGLLNHRPHTIITAADLDGVALAPAAFAAAICIYLAWRISDRPAFAWLAAGAAAVGLEALSVAALQLTDSAMVRRQAFWMAASDVSLLLAVSMVGLFLARRFAGQPAIIGSVCGLVLALFRMVAVTRFPTVDIHGAGPLPILVGFALFVIPPAWLLSRARSIPGWASARFSVAVVLFGYAHLIAYLEPHPSTMGAFVIVSCDLSGAVALSSAAIGLVRQAIVAEERDRTGLRQRIDAMETDVRRDRARIHEITSTVAGVLSASRLLRENTALDHDRRRMLGDMVHEELCRLERLLADPDSAPVPRTADLDTTIGNLALSHEARGHQVLWLPSGARVDAPPDAVAEVLNILLDNAAKHGSGDALVEVVPRPGTVEILVSDTGPGVAPEMRSRIFEWGARGPESRGQGIGLCIAEKRTREEGGYLRLQDDGGRPGQRRGTTFVVGFPAVGTSHEQ